MAARAVEHHVQYSSIPCKHMYVATARLFTTRVLFMTQTWKLRVLWACWLDNRGTRHVSKKTIMTSHNICIIRPQSKSLLLFTYIKLANKTCHVNIDKCKLFISCWGLERVRGHSVDDVSAKNSWLVSTLTHDTRLDAQALVQQKEKTAQMLFKLCSFKVNFIILNKDCHNFPSGIHLFHTFICNFSQMT